MVMTAQDTKVRPGYKQTEVGVIPGEWEVTMLGEVADVKTGPFGSTLHEKDYVDDGTPIITVEHLSEHGVVYTNLPMVSDRDRKRLNAYSLIEGDIVFSRVGSVDRNSLIKEEESGWLFSGRLLRIRLKTLDVYSPYLSYYFNQESTKQRIRAVAVGQTMASLNTQILKNIDIAFPATKSEQQAIATVLSEVDALITSLDKLIAKQRDIKQAMMQQLLTGKTRLPGFNSLLKSSYKQTDVGMIPEDWEACSLGDVVTKVGSGITPTGGEKVYKKEGRPFLRSQNVGWGHLLLDDIVFIDEETHKSFLATEIKSDDVLLNITGASIGRSAVADNRLPGGNVNQHVCIIRTDASKFSPYYLNFFLLSESGQKQIESFQAGGNRQGLNFGQIKSFQIPLPSLPEQQAIATVLSDMDAEIAALERKLEKLRALKQGMMQELLTGKTRLL